MSTVKNLMTTDLITVTPGTSVQDAVNLLADNAISGLPVIDDRGRLCGVLTEFALLRLLYDQGVAGQTVDTIMTREVITIEESASIHEAAECCLRHRIRRLIVVRDGKPVGLVSRRDLVRYAQRRACNTLRSETAAGLLKRDRNSSGRWKVLVVDDSVLIHELLCESLASTDFDVSCCFSGEDCQNFVNEIGPDLILLDRQMPGMDGLDVLHALKSNPQTRDIPVIMVTACDRPKHVAEALNAGAVDYVQKPFAPVEVQARAAAALRTLDLQRELRNARRMAEAASHSKSEFLANMSHEIRTPMTAILGFADILRESLSEDQQVETLDVIRRNGEHMLEIVNDILDISKIEAGQLHIESVACSPQRVVQEVASLLRTRADAKGLELHFQSEGDIPPAVLTDPLRFRQIVTNLLSNAIKFTERGSVTLVMKHLPLHPGGPQLTLDVIDTGIGISDEQMERLFAPFQQADNSTSRRFGGTGLGLVISRRLAEMLGGSLSARSRPGKGSVFTMNIAAPSLEDDPGEDLTLVQTATNLAMRNRPLQGVRVLLVEDGPDNRRLISLVLSKVGADVTIARDGQEGIAAVEKARAPFDVILMDLQMPRMDGYTATRRLRDDGYQGAIIALTAHAMSTDREECLQAGCDAYSSKPIQRDQLIALVARHARPTGVES